MLIYLITRKKYIIDGTCVMVVVLHQQGIFDLEDLWNFDYANQFEYCFSFNKEHDDDVGTNNNRDILIIDGI